jgi:gamma-glutamylputrescine oxidase
MKLSFWEQDVFFPLLDAFIIGGGIVGLSAALSLRARHPSWRIAIAERAPLAAGASTRNAGFACFGSPTELLDDLQHSSLDDVVSLVAKRWQGLQMLRKRLGDKALGYQASGGYEVFAQQDEASYQACREQLGAFNQALKPIFGEQAAFFPADEALAPQGLSAFQHLIYAPHEGMLHPGKMVQALLRMAQEQEIQLFHGLSIDRIEGEQPSLQLYSKDGWKFNSHRVLVATNGFARHLLPDLPMQPARNQVILTEPIPDLRLRGCFHYDQGYGYFRPVGQRILLGGFRKLDAEAESTDEFGMSPAIQQALEAFLRTQLLRGKPVEITQRWSGILGVGQEKAPILQEVRPGLWAAVRLGGMGVALGSLLGEEAAQAMSE